MDAKLEILKKTRQVSYRWNQNGSFIYLNKNYVRDITFGITLCHNLPHSEL